MIYPKCKRGVERNVVTQSLSDEVTLSLSNEEAKWLWHQLFYGEIDDNGIRGQILRKLPPQG